MPFLGATDHSDTLQQNLADVHLQKSFKQESVSNPPEARTDHPSGFPARDSEMEMVSMDSSTGRSSGPPIGKQTPSGRKASYLGEANQKKNLL